MTTPNTTESTMTTETEVSQADVRAFLEDCGGDLAAPENFPGRAASLVSLMATFGTAVARRHAAQARARAVEECAKVADRHDTGDCTREDMEARRIAADIRGLIDTKGDSE